MLTRFAILLAAALTLAGCGEEPEPQVWRIVADEIPAADQEIFTRALNLFAARCPDLFNRYWGDVVEARASVMDNFPDGVGELPYYELYGWRKNVLFTVKVVDDPQVIPGRYRAWGHRLFYYLGGGRRPGIMAGKTQSQMVCGFTPDGNNDLHVPAPEFSILDGLS